MQRAGYLSAPALCIIRSAADSAQIQRFRLREQLPVARTPWALGSIPGIREVDHWLTRSLARYEAAWAYLLLSPFLIGLLVFILGPLVFAIVLSMMRWDIMGQPQWLGTANYAEMARDEVFRKAFWNTVYYTGVTVPATIAFSLLLATLMNRKMHGVRFFRVIYFAPITISVIAVGLLWSWLYSRDFGFINYVLYLLGLPKVPWLVNPKIAMLSIIIVGVWRGLGFNIVVFIAGLQSVPRELYDASAIDGANEFQQYRHITLPMLSPTLFFALVTAFISSFQIFEQTYIMTQGGPSYSTMTLVYYIYLEGFTYLRMGYASAVSILLLLVVLLMTVFQVQFQERWVYYEE